MTNSKVKTMNDNLKKWVAALRSGEFRQCQSTLRRDDNYCCLGVACELYRREVGNGRWNQTENLYPGAGYTFEVNGKKVTGYLPPAVAEWLGTDLNPDLNTGGTVNEAASYLNDAMGLDFSKIADAIERTYEEQQ